MDVRHSSNASRASSNSSTVPQGTLSAAIRPCRKVVEGEQRVPVLLQAFDSLLAFDGIGLAEGVERRLGVLARSSHPDVLQHALGLGLLALGQLVENVGGLMHPASLLTGLGPDLADRLPEAERAIGDGEP